MLLKWKIKIPDELNDLLMNSRKSETNYVRYMKKSKINDEIKYSDRIDINNDNAYQDYTELQEKEMIEKINSTKVSKTFHELLFEYIDNSGLTDSQVYKRAFIDRRLFSKIRSDRYYHPSFGTITLLALSLKLTTKQYEDLLNTASYSLSNSSYADITLRYCFDNKIYNVIRVNNLLYTVSGKEIKNL